MTRDHVSERVRAIISDHLVAHAMEPVEITDATTFDDLGFDSLDRIDVTMNIEEEFDLEISDEDADNLRTVGGLIEYLLGLLAVPA